MRQVENAYLTNFNNKINLFKWHEKYAWLRQYADNALRAFDMPPCYGGIAAEDFIDRITKMSVEYIADWLDGKNKLEWEREAQR